MSQRNWFDFERILNWAQAWLSIPLVFTLFILLLAWSIDSARSWLQAHGLRNLDVPAIVGIALGATIIVLIAFQQQLKRLDTRLALFSPSGSSEIIPEGIRDIYPLVDRILGEIGSGKGADRTFDVLGLTLYSAWPLLLDFALRPPEGALRGWRVNVFCLSPDFIRKNAYFSPEWAGESEAKLAAMKRFYETHAQSLKQLGTELTVSQYAFFPAVHGFRTNAGHLFISYTHWAGDLIEGPTQFYEFFQASDHSLRAERYRALFESWIDRARREPATNKVI